MRAITIQYKDVLEQLNANGVDRADFRHVYSSRMEAYKFMANEY